ncbi:MAG: AbrB/MazE/SpoVT family DNA-binding domain-containing protein [Spirochaetaceae bacterium]|nr:AbrB/MazE/SpoVT family DNA-binding domain-containing protein [Spirochaetaceae bacterium]
MKTIVSEKGQITIPKKIRDNLGLSPGTVLEIESRGGMLTAVKHRENDLVGKWRGRGSLPGGVTVDEYINGSRG